MPNAGTGFTGVRGFAPHTNKMSIEFKNIHFSYFKEGKDILPGISGSFDRNKITVLTGASGCGKSTLLYIAAGIYPGDTGFLNGGEVLIEGLDPASLKPEKRCRIVGMMFQNPELQFCMDTVRNELAFVLENISIPKEEMDARIEAALDFADVEELIDRNLHSLSGGEKQKVMLACLKLIEPKWLLLDEPFANIDEKSAGEIALKLKQLHEENNMGILAVDHRLDTWLNIADEVRILEKGLLRDEIMNPKELDGDFLKSLGIIVPGKSYAPELPECPEGKTILEIKRLSVKQGEKNILGGLSAKFSKGRIYAVVGNSGCGKSTLFGAISGIYKYSGEIILNGMNIKKALKKFPGTAGFVTQDPQDQFIGGTVKNEVMQSLRKSEDAEKLSEEILRSIKLWKYRDISPYMLSQGQQRRLGVAALMAYQCELLICDEPTYAQDRNGTMAVMGELCKRAKSGEIALIFSTHDRQLACDYADVIFELREGELHEID